MNADKYQIKTIFGQVRRHLVPLFQRTYVWKRNEHWVPLWDDIVNVAERILGEQSIRPHFLGAIVLDTERVPYGHVECRLLIDGQQRLTTIQLVFEAFADVCKALGQERHYQALLQYTRNNDPLSNDPDEVYKVWPTNHDQPDFRKVMEAVDLTDLKKSYPEHRDGTLGNKIADAYAFFFEAIRTWLMEEDGTEARVDALFRTLVENIIMVVIDLEPQDDAQVIFETLNDRGTRLLPSDLVKNQVFHSAQRMGLEVEGLYKKYWEPLESDFWKQERGRGHARRPLIDTYLMQFLILKTQNDVPVTHLYDTYKKWVLETSAAPELVLGQLAYYSRIYQRFEQGTASARENAFFKRLQAMDVVTAYPFLLELYARYGQDEHDQVLAVLKDLESWLVRRMICQLSTRGYNRLFVDYLWALNAGEGTVSERFRQMLLSSTSDSAKWPTDAEFKFAWLNTPVYRSLVQGRIRMLFEALEDRMRSEKTENIVFTDSLPIEHLMPQSWRQHYPLPVSDNEAEATARRDTAIHTMGNLTLLTQKLNSSVSNGPWLVKATAESPDYTGKRDEILKFSNLGINQMLRDTAEWTEESFEPRGEALFNVALRAWPRPKPEA